MSIRFLESRKQWQVDLVLRGKRIRKLFKDKKDAKEFERDVNLRKLNLPGISQVPTINRAFQDYLDTTSSFKAAAAKMADERFLAFALHFFTKDRDLSTLDQVKVADLELFMLWIAKPQQVGLISKQAWAAPTVAKCVKLVKAVLRKAFINEIIPRNVGEHLKISQGTPQRRRAMTPQEFQILFRDAPPWLQSVLLFMRLTAARPSSIAYLKWGDINFSTATLLLSSRKGEQGKMKTIPIPIYPELFSFLASQKRNETEAVFVDEKGSPVTAHKISLIASRLIKKLGFKGVVLYGLRHALATDLIQAGVSTEIARKAMGHSNTDQLASYTNSVELESIGKALTLIRGGKTDE